MLTQAPRGTRDMLPQDAYLWHMLEAKMRELAALWGYREIRTPIFEHTELFLRGVGGTTDIVTKEMYTFKDKGDRSITLRPEGTAGAVRAFLEGRLYAEPLPSKVYYLAAPIFRYENPQAGRLREHHQFGMECFGGKEPTVEAELISTLFGLLTGMGLKNLTVHINSIGCPECRPKYHQALKNYLGERIHDMCETCRARFEKNPLRILDCKEEKCKQIVKDDGLVSQLGGPDTPAAGFGIGVERILMELRNQDLLPPAPAVADVYVANLGAEMKIPAFAFAQSLRDLGVKADSDLAGRSLKAQFKFADKIAARYVAIVGGEEYERGVIKLRDMQTKEEKELPLESAAKEIADLII